MGKAWNETESPFARQVLEFVNQETGGLVAFFTRKGDGTYETFVQVNSWGGFLLEAPTERELALKYWEYYYKLVKKQVQLEKHPVRWIFRLPWRQWKNYSKSVDRLARWDAWKKEHVS